MGRSKRPTDDGNPDTTYGALLKESLAFREGMAVQYKPVLAAFLRSQPLSMLADKRAAVKAVNDRLRYARPRHPLPRNRPGRSRLVAHSGNHPEIGGAFRIEPCSATRRGSAPVNYPDLPPLELMPEPPADGAGPA